MLLRTSHNLLPRQYCAHASPRLLVHAADVRGPRRSLCSARAGSDKSWGDILSSAADVAKDVVNKVKDTVGGAIGGVLAPKEKQPLERQPQQRQRPPVGLTERPGGLLGNLMGRAIGGMMASAVNQIGQQLEKAAEESRGAYEEAAARIEASPKLRSVMGGEVRAGPIMSQGMSSSSINGVSTKTINLIFPVYGPSGQVCQAQVVSNESARSRRSDVSVRLPDGRVLKIEEGPRGGQPGSSGQAIDVEFTEVR